MALSNEADGNDAERSEGAELAMVAGDNFTTQFLGEGDAEAVGKRNPPPGLNFTTRCQKRRLKSRRSMTPSAYKETIADRAAEAPLRRMP